MEEEKTPFQKRQVAYKVRIDDINNSVFLKDDSLAGYIKLNEITISRVNIVAFVVYKNEPGSNFESIIVDDGSSKISLRSFESKVIFSSLEVGDVVNAIGKIRKYNNEKYIIAESVKKLTDQRWLEVRKVELKSPLLQKNTDEIKEEISTVQSPKNLNEEIYLLIKKLDTGDGASIEDVIRESKKEESEDIIEKLLQNGDIFEIRPGRVKVLE